MIEVATRRWRSDVLLERLGQAGVPAGPINSIAQALADPQIRHRGMQLALPGDGAEQPRPGIRSPMLFSDASLALDRAAPRLGGGTAEP